MGKSEMRSVCQIRTLTGLPCDRCKFGDKCKTYQKQLKKEGKENEQKKQKSRSRRKEDSSK